MVAIVYARAPGRVVPARLASHESRPGPKVVTVGSSRHEPATGTSRLVTLISPFGFPGQSPGLGQQLKIIQVDHHASYFIRYAKYELSPGPGGARPGIGISSCTGRLLPNGARGVPSRRAAPSAWCSGKILLIISI